MEVYIGLTRAKIDIDALELSEKILLITFVILPTIINFIFILFIICRRGMQSFTQCRYTIRMAMAVGGILFGMFPMLIFAVQIFEQELMFSCTAFTLARIYMKGILPVLYSFGFIILAVDIAVRSKIIQSRTKSCQFSRFMTTPPFAIIAGLLPWIGALTLVCPLTLTYIDWDNRCHQEPTQTHIKAQIIVYGIALPCATLVTAIVCACLSQAHSKNLDEFDNSMAVGGIDFHDVSAVTPTTANSIHGPEYRHLAEIPNTSDTNSFETQLGSSNLDTSFNAASISTDTNNIISSETDVNHYKPMSAFTRQAIDGLYDRIKIRSEWLIILVCSVILSITVVPYNSYIVYIMNNSQRSPAFTIHHVYEVNTEAYISIMVLWYIMYLYPVLVPLISLVV